MDPYAVVETGGKQYLVRKGDVLLTELLAGEKGQTAPLGRVLAMSDGQALSVGTPVLAGAQVAAQIMDQLRGPKIVSFKKKRRKGYHKKIGHRQELMKLKVEELRAG